MRSLRSLLLLGIALGVFPLATGCMSGTDADSQADDTHAITLERARVESRYDGDQLVTSLYALDDGALIGTATWDLSLGTAEMATEGIQTTITLDAGVDLTLDEASNQTYAAWASLPAPGQDEVPYAVTCTVTASGCCVYVSCSDCVATDTGYYCVVGGTTATCNYNSWHPTYGYSCLRA